MQLLCTDQSVQTVSEALIGHKLTANQLTHCLPCFGKSGLAGIGQVIRVNDSNDKQGHAYAQIQITTEQPDSRRKPFAQECGKQAC